MRRKGRFGIKSNSTIKRCSHCIKNLSCIACRGACIFNQFKNGYDNVIISQRKQKQNESKFIDEEEELIGYNESELSIFTQFHNSIFSKNVFENKIYRISHPGVVNRERDRLRTNQLRLEPRCHIKNKNILFLKRHLKYKECLQNRYDRRNMISKINKEEILADIRKQKKIFELFGPEHLY